MVLGSLSLQVNIPSLSLSLCRYKLKDDVRVSLYDHCNKWTKAIGNSRTFMGGDKPNLADLVIIIQMHKFANNY